MDEYSWLLDSVDEDIIEAFMTGETEKLDFELNDPDFKDENEEELLKCGLCPNMCEFACPLIFVHGKETYSPARKSKLGFLFSKGKIDADELADVPYYCVACDACEENCPMEFNVSDLLIPIREDLFEQGSGPEGILYVKDNLEDTQTIYEDIEYDETDGKEVGEGKTLYFRSCVGRKEVSELVDSTFDLIKELEGEVQTLEEEICCGSPALSLGFKEEFSSIAEEVVEDLNDSGAEKIVCSCPSCAKTLRETYDEQGFEVEPEVLHITEYLAEKVKDVDLELGDSEEITYHDPCTLARDLEVTEEPREVLEEISNLETKEPYFSKEDTRCCGRGGALRHVNEEVSENIAEDRIQHLEDWSDKIVTSCPSCKAALGEDGEVVSLSELVLRALK